MFSIISKDVIKWVGLLAIGSITGASLVVYSGGLSRSSSGSSSPIIAGISPTGNQVGTAVSITGENFNTDAANNTVKFNGTTNRSTGTLIFVSTPVTTHTGLKGTMSGTLRFTPL